MSLTAAGAAPAANRGGKDIAFAVGIVLILCLFFLPVPAVMIDFGLATVDRALRADPDGGVVDP